MNIVSVLVGITIMGAAAPSVVRLSLSPVVAQKRAENFGVAESLAVTYSAANEGEETKQATIPDVCEEEDKGGGAWEVKCRGGEVDSKYVQYVTRSYRLRPEDGSGYENPSREYAFEAPLDHSYVPCQVDDPWGVIWYNKHLRAGNMDACIPPAARTPEAYLDSDPADWLYDLSNYGWGRHPLY